MKIALIVGHSKEEQGARSQSGLSEYAYNKELVNAVFIQMGEALVDLVQSGFKGAVDARRFYRTTDIPDLIKEVLTWGPDLTVSFHCNSYSVRTVRGTEVLMWDGNFHNNEKIDLKLLAGTLSERISLLLGTRDRGLVPVEAEMAGGPVLSELPDCLMLESFFLSNLGDTEAGVTHQEAMASIVASRLVQYALEVR